VSGAPYPGIGPTRTMYAVLHGELELHPWWDPATASEDAYSLFYKRSSAMGWLENPGFWGMNDAAFELDSESQPPRVAWFQVGLTEPIPKDRPLPVHPFLVCIDDVIGRIGTLRLEAVRILLPDWSLSAPSSGIPSVLGIEPDWFADGDPRQRSAIRVTLDGGEDPSIQAAAPEMLQRIQSSYQDVYRCDSFSLAEDDAVLLPNTPVGLWRETEQHLVTFYGTLAEWSLDALGWLAAFLAHIAFVHGVSRPLMLTAAREGE